MTFEDAVLQESDAQRNGTTGVNVKTSINIYRVKFLKRSSRNYSGNKGNTYNAQICEDTHISKDNCRCDHKL